MSTSDSIQYTLDSIPIRYGNGSGLILLDNVLCRGGEADLLHCDHNGIQIHNCDSSETAGVFCEGKVSRLFQVSLKENPNTIGHCLEGSIRLLRSSEDRDYQSDQEEDDVMSGRVEVCVGGRYGAVCDDDSWDNKDASVVCKQQGFSRYGMTIVILHQI